MPTLVLESGTPEKQLEAPQRNGIEDASILAPLRSGESSAAEARGILEEEDLGARDLSTEPGTSTVGGWVGAVKTAPPVSTRGEYARTGAQTWGSSFPLRNPRNVEVELSPEHVGSEDILQDIYQLQKLRRILMMGKGLRRNGALRLRKLRK